MIGKLGSLLFILVCAVCSARGDTIASPITIGFPVDPDAFLPEFNLYVTPIPGIQLGSSENTSSIFYFDLAPGWIITGISLFDPVDYATQQTDFNSWGIEYLQEVVLCTSDDVCSTGTAGRRDGGASLPSLAPLPHIGPNQGFYYLSAYSLNTQAMTIGNASLVIHLAQGPIPPPVPEPGTMLLLSTGTLGLAFLRRSFQRNERP